MPKHRNQLVRKDRDFSAKAETLLLLLPCLDRERDREEQRVRERGLRQGRRVSGRDRERRRERARERLGERKKEGEEDIGREKERGIIDIPDTRSGIARRNGSSVQNDTGEDRAIRRGLGLLLRLRLWARAKLGSPAPSPLFVCGGGGGGEIAKE
ncbi:hypothetical protein ACLOJK_028274 [Asimina triloba]